ncbi:hypothetical protein DFH09DRAFT_1101856 [Mycena vulgaris]|nr:hypothetical protein DFH09DRAFT_1101856 [Mycena vulgaris]
MCRFFEGSSGRASEPLRQRPKKEIPPVAPPFDQNFGLWRVKWPAISRRSQSFHGILVDYWSESLRCLKALEFSPDSLWIQWIQVYKINLALFSVNYPSRRLLGGIGDSLLRRSTFLGSFHPDFTPQDLNSTLGITPVVICPSCSQCNLALCTCFVPIHPFLSFSFESFEYLSPLDLFHNGVDLTFISPLILRTQIQPGCGGRNSRSG